MKLLVISSVPIIKINHQKFMYGPYQKEMKIWAKYVDEIQFCCPIWKEHRNLLVDEISFPIGKIIKLKEFDIQSISKLPKALYFAILNFWIILKTINSADHIHLRCPGNIGLLGCIAQLFYPSKIKTAKYAGNWDPNALQPLTYKWQRKLLSNTFLTRNMQVMVYGKWPNQTKNIKEFFTASYSDAEKCMPNIKNFDKQIELIFIGGLTPGKQPLKSVMVAKKLYQKGVSVHLSIYGEGVEREKITSYIQQHQLQHLVTLFGNQDKETIKKALQKSHFLIFISKSEGWPKVVAEAMFWGCLPITTVVSCVPYMLGNQLRGSLVSDQVDEISEVVESYLTNEVLYQQKCKEAVLWSQQFTLETFEKAIKELL